MVLQRLTIYIQMKITWLTLSSLRFRILGLKQKRVQTLWDFAGGLRARFWCRTWFMPHVNVVFVAHVFVNHQCSFILFQKKSEIIQILKYEKKKKMYPLVWSPDRKKAVRKFAARSIQAPGFFLTQTDTLLALVYGCVLLKIEDRQHMCNILLWNVTLF